MMNIGGRINQKLKELGWERKKLLAEVPDLSTAALSNLIRRDSVRSEWDEKIATALGVSVMWLVYGKEPDRDITYRTLTAEEPTKISAFPNPMHPAVAEVVSLMNKTDELGKGMILIKVRDIAKERSLQTNKPASSK